MIQDYFRNRRRYPQIPFLKEIERFVEERDCTKIPDGEIEILGRELFVRTAFYPTGSAEEKKFEAHRLYADLQYVVEGREIMEYSIAPDPSPVTSYDAPADIQFFDSVRGAAPLLVPAGQFIFFFPGELHKPGCHAGESQEMVKKLVFKIRMSEQ